MKAKDLLYKENLTLALISDRGIIKSKDRGILPLYKIYKENKEYLQGAQLSDRATGRAAAILLASGGLAELYTDLISQPALDLLRGQGIRVAYKDLVDLILNKDKTGPCPMEKLAEDQPPADILIERIGGFFEQAI